MADEKQLTPEQAAKEWEEYVRSEVNTILNKLLPEAISGSWGMKYVRPIIRIDPMSGQPIEDTTKATGVKLIIELIFAGTIEFPETLPEGAEVVE